MTYTTIISVQELINLQKQNTPLMIFDCSFDLNNPEAGYQAYLHEHIPSAHYVSLDTTLSEHEAKNPQMSAGRHPLPTREKFGNWLSKQGFENTMQAVVYDSNNTMFAGRLWWMLKWLGHEAAAVLDGGLSAWKSSGAAIDTPISTTPQNPRAFQIKPALVSLVNAAEVSAALKESNCELIDARATVRFRGEQEPLDAVAGHIPSAHNHPFTKNFNESGMFKSCAELKAQWNELLGQKTPEKVIHYCGSGVSAIPNIISMLIAGYGPTHLYAGGWSDWSRNPQNLVARGD